MADKLEVLQGPGLVARFGEVAVWAGPPATTALQAHLVSEAQGAARAPSGGDQLANSLVSVLQRGDPEPQSPFAVVGPGANGLTLFLHGPVQAWDSGRWLFPQPVPGWMVTTIGRPWPLIVLPYGAPPPPQSQQGNPFDLVMGAVPGTGFIMLRPPVGPGQAQAPPASTTAALGGPGPANLGAGGADGPPSVGPAYAGELNRGIAPALAASAPSLTAGASTLGAGAPPSTASAPLPNPQPGPATSTGGAGSVDLRRLATGFSSPLPLASARTGPRVGAGPQITGIACARGHINHPRASTCARCGNALPVGVAQVTGPRPPIGILLADDGSIWSLDGGCLIGSDPRAPEAQGGTAQAIAMRAGSNHTMAPVQAEVQVRGWSAYLVDRGAEGGTCLQGPAVEGWSQLSRNEQRELANGAHLSGGGRVLTFLSAWPG